MVHAGWRIEQKKKKKERTHGHRQLWVIVSGWGGWLVEEGIRKINGNG